MAVMMLRESGVRVWGYQDFLFSTICQSGAGASVTERWRARPRN